MSAFGLVAWIACGLSVQGGTDGELELRLEGPLRQVHLDAVRVPTRVVTDLAAGEAVTVRVPWLPVDALTGPRLRAVEGGGSARVERILDGPQAAPAALVRRPLPRPVEVPVRIPPVGWWLFVAGILAVGAARRRPMSAAIIGFGFGVLLAVLPHRAPEVPVVAVLEVGEFGAWWVHVGLGELTPPEAAHPALATEPPGANWEWLVDANEPARARRRAMAAVGTLLVARSVGPEVVELGEAGNEIGDLADVWTRSGVGAWSFRGVWDQGAALPAARAGGSLPTWLRAGAAPGREVWIGRFREARGGVGEAWVRVIGPAGT
jgi:hypothetical protein